MALVYRHRNPHNLEVFYVGMSISNNNRRPNDLKNRSKSWKEYVDKNGIPLVEIIKEDLSRTEAEELEIFLIQEYGRKHLSKGNLINQTKGGDHIKDQSGKNNFFYGKGNRQLGNKNHMFGKGFFGEDNPMFGMTGDKNPFYGKRHSEEFKKYKMNLHGFKISFKGIVYSSIREAERKTKYSRFKIKKHKSFKNL